MALWPYPFNIIRERAIVSPSDQLSVGWMNMGIIDQWNELGLKEYVNEELLYLFLMREFR